MYIHNLRYFLVLVKYYKRFMDDFSKLVISLMQILNKYQQWWWISGIQATFEKLKEDFIIDHILALPNFIKPFEVRKNTLDYALGGVLV